jgi:excinuclease ABC subunit A
MQVIVIEHSLDVIETTGWTIDLGPEGGDAGGDIIAQVTPVGTVGVPVSHTRRFLRPAL